MPAIIVYGKRVGTTLTVCTDNNCPIHDPRAAARLAQQEQENPTPVMTPAAEEETEEEAAARKQKYEQEQKEYEQEQERRAEVRRQEQEREEQAWETERARTEKLHKARTATFDRILDNAPVMFTTAQLRVVLRALVNVDPYDFLDHVAEHFAAGDENQNKSAEEIVLGALDGIPDDKLTAFALRLGLTGSTSIPREGETDTLTEVATAFLPTKQKKTTSKKAKTPTPIKAASKKSAANKQVAA